GIVTLNSPLTAGQSVKAAYFYDQTIGMKINVNHAPVLSAPGPVDSNTNDHTINLTFGSPATSFTYSVIYADADNQPPAYVNVVIDGTSTQAMTIDPSLRPPIDYTRGVKYNYTTTGTTLGTGNHSYHFEASDGADL